MPRKRGFNGIVKAKIEPARGKRAGSWISAFSLALLIGNRAGSLASGLAGALALAAASLFGGSLKVSLVDSNNVLQKKHLFLLPVLILLLLL